MMNQSELTELFRKEVHDRGELIDPEDELDWLALTFGWALGRGLSPKEAREFAIYIRYNTTLG